MFFPESSSLLHIALSQQAEISSAYFQNHRALFQIFSKFAQPQTHSPLLLLLRLQIQNNHLNHSLLLFHHSLLLFLHHSLLLLFLVSFHHLYLNQNRDPRLLHLLLHLIYLDNHQHAFQLRLLLIFLVSLFAFSL